MLTQIKARVHIAQVGNYDHHNSQAGESVDIKLLMPGTLLPLTIWITALNQELALVLEQRRWIK